MPHSGRRVPVSTILTEPERRYVDAVGTDLFEAVHRDSIDDVVADVRQRRVRATVVSVARCLVPAQPRIMSRIASIVRDFPHVAAVALLTDVRGSEPAALLALGRSGVRTLVDARQPVGWRTLRDTIALHEPSDWAFEAAALTQLEADLGEAPGDCRRFFTLLFTAPPHIVRVEQLAQLLDVLPTTLASRFSRHALPSAKSYLAWARLARAAALFEDPALSVAAAATMLEYSSPQSFGRHLRTSMGLTPSDFRRRYTARAMLERFRQDLVLPFLPTLRRFSPLAPACIGGRSRVRPG